MKEHITQCPCCNGQLKIVIDEDSGKFTSTVFFNEENQEDIKDFLEFNGIEFGMKGSD